MTERVCIICGRSLNDVEYCSLNDIKPRFVKQLLLHYPALAGKETMGGDICLSHIRKSLQQRVDDLLQEDLSQFSKLQEDAMRNLVRYELEENTWQKQFDRDRSFGERAADNVAKFGGSWAFVLSLLAFLAVWVVLNLSLGQSGNAWDSYPFILLNLFLSMLAAGQAPVIMMAQNRQEERDRAQNTYVAQAILSNEHQTRLVDAKLDHLLSFQWKRLLEIQDIQTQLLELHVKRVHQGSDSDSEPEDFTKEASPRSMMKGGASKFWSSEIRDDGLTMALMRNYFNTSPSTEAFIFSRWHEDGDNYTGTIQDIELEILDRKVTSIHFTMAFSEPTASLDDILSGEGTAVLRNDFDLPHMVSHGRISKVFITFRNGSTTTWINGELPARYKPAFARRRDAHITKIVVSYDPPAQVAILDIPANYKLSHITATLSSAVGIVSLPADTYFYHATTTLPPQGPQSDDRLDSPLAYYAQLVGPQPLACPPWSPMYAHEESASSLDRRQSSLVRVKKGSTVAQPVVHRAVHFDRDEDRVSASLVPTVGSGTMSLKFKNEFVGPATVLLYCETGRVTFYGTLEPHEPVLHEVEQAI